MYIYTCICFRLIQSPPVIVDSCSCRRTIHLPVHHQLPVLRSRQRHGEPTVSRFRNTAKLQRVRTTPDHSTLLRHLLQLAVRPSHAVNVARMREPATVQRPVRSQLPHLERQHVRQHCRPGSAHVYRLGTTAHVCSGKLSGCCAGRCRGGSHSSVRFRCSVLLQQHQYATPLSPSISPFFPAFMWFSCGRYQRMCNRGVSKWGDVRRSSGRLPLHVYGQLHWSNMRYLPR